SCAKRAARRSRQARMGGAPPARHGGWPSSAGEGAHHQQVTCSENAYGSSAVAFFCVTATVPLAAGWPTISPPVASAPVGLAVATRLLRSPVKGTLKVELVPSWATVARPLATIPRLAPIAPSAATAANSSVPFSTKSSADLSSSLSALRFLTTAV